MINSICISDTTLRHSCFVLCLSLLLLLAGMDLNAASQVGVNLKQLNCATEVSAQSSAKLPLPSEQPLVDYEKALYRWIISRDYANAELNWCHDGEIRDTGPFINGLYHGTHPAVQIYYSPEVMSWMHDRSKGIKSTIADGAVIIKEMYSPPAAIYSDIRRIKGEEEYQKIRMRLLGDWTVMVKDSKGSADGWFWASISAPEVACTGSAKATCINNAVKKQLDTLANNNAENAFARSSGLRTSGYGMPCLRCHASAENELTFSSLQNISGFSDHGGLEFVDDGTWRTESFFAGNKRLKPLLDDPQLEPLFNVPLAQLPFVAQENIRTQAKRADSPEHGRAPAGTKQGASNEYINFSFLETFSIPNPPKLSDVKRFPKQWLDHVVQNGGEPQDYITSDNCMGCHGGLSDDTFGTVMFIADGPSYGDGYDISEYGEWRWSPMGLAGRDPIFHAQLETEMALLDEDAKRGAASGLVGPVDVAKAAVTNTCLSCHGAMGQRQLEMDAAHQTDKEPKPLLDPNFKPEYFYYTEQLSSADKQSESEQQYHMYGELAREGISCMICHRISPPKAADVKSWKPNSSKHKNWINAKTDKTLAYFLFHNNTGRFEKSPTDVINGPYDVTQKPMDHAVHIKPEKNAFTSSSEMCGTCHTINLPDIGSTSTALPVLQAAETNPGLKVYPHSIEQATFLEWQNSSFAYGDTEQSCQDCHMPTNFEGIKASANDTEISVDRLVTKIASIQDDKYPEADHSLPAKEREVVVRDTYKRHTHVGLNGFLLNMFKQFEPILGVAQSSYMTGASHKGVDLALASMEKQATDDTVAMSIDKLSISKGNLVAEVTAKNKVGHRFPSGVAFRRAFIEFVVLDEKNNIVWGSGRTNNAGVIVDNSNQVLNTEFLDQQACGENNQEYCYQKHHQVITSDKQVQIYEELTQNNQYEFTTSFVHRVHHVKDNRLLPDGWRKSSTFRRQGEVIRQFMVATDPSHTGNDPDYKDQGKKFKGQDSLTYKIKLDPSLLKQNLKVRATMYYQAIPPYWLKHRFTDAPNGEATRRLYYLASRLDLRDTPLKQWKFKLDSVTKSLSN